MHLLLVAPSAPPKSGPEALQVSRFLAALDPSIKVTLVTTINTGGWSGNDNSLLPNRPLKNTICLSMPAHVITHSIWNRMPFAYFQVPDSGGWLRHMSRAVMRQLDSPPDVIYSRSAPFSAALLARKLKKEIHRPWLMHLSDPWVGSPYRPMSRHRHAMDLALEASCFEDSDHVTVTTDGQAAFYRTRYATGVHKISVTPNMTAPIQNSVPRPNLPNSKQLRIVHTGALYGDRDPGGLLEALSRLRARNAKLAKSLSVNFYGNMSSETAAQIASAPECLIHPAVSYEHAIQLQADADLLLSIEPNPTNELHPHFLLSKIVDYLASGRPILALACPMGVAAEYCKRGYGWTFAPNDAVGISNFLELQTMTFRVRTYEAPKPPSELAPQAVTSQIETLLRCLTSIRDGGKASGA